MMRVSTLLQVPSICFTLNISLECVSIYKINVHTEADVMKLKEALPIIKDTKQIHHMLIDRTLYTQLAAYFTLNVSPIY